MTDIDKAEVYRKAAEIIVRDGKCEERLFSRAAINTPTHIRMAVSDTSQSVCAVGACLRAEYELYGELSPNGYADPYGDYSFSTEHENKFGEPSSVVAYNDGNTKAGIVPSAEDVALELKKYAEDISRP